MLSNGALAVHVLPEKGADIVAIVEAATGRNLLFEAPWGLQPPGAGPREGSMGEPFLANYEGGWQELLPNTNDRCKLGGVELPFHGEVATVAWSWDVETDADGTTLQLQAYCRALPLRLRRRMSLAGSHELVLDEEVTNQGRAEVCFTWGHHLVLGPPLVGAGARMSLSGGRITTPAEPWENTHRLAPGQRSQWPLARLRSGDLIDISAIPGPDVVSHDDVFIDELKAGWAQVVNARVGLGFRLEWDPAVFTSLVSWQPFGGARTMPLAGAYALGLEPWAFPGNLEAAVDAGRALTLRPGETLTTRLAARLLRPD